MSRLAGKVAIVTGGAKGQGEAIVRAFLVEGSAVEIADVDSAAGQALCDELAGEVGADRVHFTRHDVSDESSWTALVEGVNERFGPVDVLVNNAGITLIGSIGRVSLADAQRVWDTNLQGCYLGMRAVVPTMRAHGGGSIVNTSSVEGLAGGGYVIAYCGAKWAIRGMTKAGAQEFARHGIRVNSVHPGMIDTPMTRAMADDDAMAQAGHRIPLGRVGLPADVAPTYVFLASDESGYLTGAEIAVDGGATSGHSLGM